MTRPGHERKSKDCLTDNKETVVQTEVESGLTRQFPGGNAGVLRTRHLWQAPL